MQLLHADPIQIIREELDVEPLAWNGMLDPSSLALPLDSSNDARLRPGRESSELPEGPRLLSVV
jgi:hypothetical protein